MPLEERFWAKVDQTDGCWLWTAARDHAGYGKFKVDGRHQMAHRVAYSLAHGLIPSGYEIHHRCEVKGCVRPSHLRLVTPKEHAAIDDRAHHSVRVHGRVTRCVNGHEYDEANTYVLRGSRFCRECRRVQAQRIRDRHKGLATCV